VVEIAYGLQLGLYNATAKVFKTGCSVAANIKARRGTTVLFTATMPSSLAVGSTAAAQALATNSTGAISSFMANLGHAQTAAGVTTSASMTVLSVSSPTAAAVPDSGDDKFPVWAYVLIGLACLVGLLAGIYGLLNLMGVINRKEGIQTENGTQLKGSHTSLSKGPDPRAEAAPTMGDSNATVQI
jgi:hypothetical protein